MFAYYFVPVSGRGFPEVEGAVLATLDDAQELAEAAYREAAGLRGEGAEGPTRVRATVGDLVRGLHETAVPLTWEVAAVDPLFERLDAELVLADLGPNLVHLSFRGTYPRTGRGDRRRSHHANLHRATELVVKGFLDRLAAAVGARLPLELPA
jgi:hypothetical protein